MTRRLLELGFHIHSFDKMLFIFPDPSNKPFPCAVLIVYVDDFVLTYNERFPFENFLGTFKWGASEKVLPGKPHTYKEKEITVHCSDSEITLSITQKEFIQGLDMPRVSCRGRKDEVLSPSDWPEFRSISGCLQWLSGQCRLDISSAVSLSNKGQETTYGDLEQLYQALTYVKETPGSGIVIYPVPLDDSTILVEYSDSSWANAHKSAGQHGQLVLLAASNVSETTCIGALLDWKTGRSKRVCRPTLAAEAVAADTCTDRLAFVQYMLAELIFGIPAHRVGKRLTTLLATDCKSLYDCVAADNPNIEDKRSLVNVRSIQELINARTIQWLPTSLQRADGLTKVSATLRDELSGLPSHLYSCERAKKTLPV